MSAHETSERAENASVPICPHCGFNLVADRPIERDGWVIDPTGQVAFEGAVREVKATWAGILYALAATPGSITTDALLNRVSDSENVNVIAVQVSRLRRWLAEAGFPDPIYSSRGRGNYGYRWRTAA
jgi:DNA-binding response OmpR family regulator